MCVFAADDMAAACYSIITVLLNHQMAERQNKTELKSSLTHGLRHVHAFAVPDYSEEHLLIASSLSSHKNQPVRKYVPSALGTVRPMRIPDSSFFSKKKGSKSFVSLFFLMW